MWLFLVVAVVVLTATLVWLAHNPSPPALVFDWRVWAGRLLATIWAALAVLIGVAEATMPDANYDARRFARFGMLAVVVLFATILAWRRPDASGRAFVLIGLLFLVGYPFNLIWPALDFGPLMGIGVVSVVVGLLLFAGSKPEASLAIG